MIVYSDWFEMYGCHDEELEEAVVTVHVLLDDEGDEVLGFSESDLKEKLSELEAVYKRFSSRY